MDKKELFEAAAKSIREADMVRAEEVARAALKEGIDPLEMITEGFTVGIVTVGDLFEKGELFLPELVQCSEVMKKASDILSASIQDEKKTKTGKVVIATVEGDVHDIGKGIVVSLIKAHGFEVIDLGRDVPVMKIIEKADQVDADIIGTSALLTTTMVGQKKLEEILRKEGLRDRFKTIVGGAPVTERWAKRIGANAYAENASDAVKKISELLKQ